jgi:O-antigen/teichoic acid export membrane protein
MSSGRTIARNAGVLFGAQLVTFALALALTIFVPRYLGATALGKLHMATSLWAIVAVAVTFGMDILLTKEIARDPARTGQMFGTSVALRLLLYLVALGPLALYVRLAGYPADTVAVIAIVGLSNLVWQIILTCQAALQGLERMEFISLGIIAGKLFNTVVTIALLVMGYGVAVVAAVTVGAALVTLVIQLFFLRRLQPLSLAFDRRLALPMLRGGAPYLLSGLFLVGYQQVDIVIISLLVDEKTIGWYGAADHLFATFLFIPAVFMQAVFPALARSFHSQSGEHSRLVARSFDLLFLLSVPIGLGLLTLARPIVGLLFGPDFGGSVPVLAVLGIVLILTYQNILLGRFLVSADRQNAWTLVMAVATVATIPLDLLLIPWTQRAFGNGAIGGALSFVVTELGMLVVGLRLLPAGSLGANSFSRAARTLAAGLVMAAVVWWARDFFLAVPIALGGLTYGLLALALGLLPRDELALGLSLLRSLPGLARRSAQKAPALTDTIRP